MTDRSAIVIDGENFGYSFKQKSTGENLIYVRIIEDKSWNSSAYRKSFHKANKVQELDLNEIWYWNPGGRQINTKKINLENRFDYDRLSYFETYYPIQPKTERLLVLGFVTKSGKKTYCTRTDLKLNGKDEINFNSLKQVQEKEFLNDLYKENYSQNKVLTVKIDATGNYHNVDVNPNVKLRYSEYFKRCEHKFSGSDINFQYLVLDSKSKCTFEGFKASQYKNDNLKDVGVYFHKTDYNHRVPLLIEFKESFNDFETNSNKVWRLKSINKNSSDDIPEKWTKIYKNESINEDVSEILDQIYTGTLREDIQTLINYSEDNSTVIGAVSGTVGTISAIGTGIGGFFLYKNSALVITFLRSLF